MKNTELNGVQIVSGIVGTFITFGVLTAVGLYWLVEQSVNGNQAAAMLLTGIMIFITIFVVLAVLLALIWGISKIQQSAARSNMELMKINAIENQQIMNDVQKGLLLQAQTQQRLTAANIQTERFGANNQNGRFLDSANVIDQAFGGDN